MKFSGLYNNIGQIIKVYKAADGNCKNTISLLLDIYLYYFNWYN